MFAIKLYTKLGDQGKTGLLGGERVPKHHPRIEAIGTIDELNSVLGWAAVLCGSDFPWLREVQATLFDIGAELATQSAEAPVSISERSVAWLETLIDDISRGLPPLKQFILPGGSEAASRLHIARSTARRAERTLAALHAEEQVRPVLLAYMNRLSDLLFAAAREANRKAGVADVPYKADRSSSKES